nr:ribonucleoside-diphosphate reductase large subunit-like [Ipomoea batatas]
MELLLQMEVPRKPPPQKRATVKPIKPEAVIVISPDTKEEVKEKNSLRRKAAAEDSSRKTYTATLTARSKKTFTSSTRKLRHITYAEDIYKFYKEAEEWVDLLLAGHFLRETMILLELFDLGIVTAMGLSWVMELEFCFWKNLSMRRTTMGLSWVMELEFCFWKNLSMRRKEVQQSMLNFSVEEPHPEGRTSYRDLFYALWVPDLFMERVQGNGQWSLFCPNEAPGLADCCGEEFEELYTEYERKEKIEDIDAGDVYNELAVVEYAEDIYKFARKLRFAVEGVFAGGIKQKNMAADGRNRRVLGDIGNMVTFEGLKASSSFLSPDTKEEVKEKKSLHRKAAAEDSSGKTYTATLTAQSKAACGLNIKLPKEKIEDINAGDVYNELAVVDALGFMDDPYLVRNPFSLLNQDPAEADKPLKIQRELDETKNILKDMFSQSTSCFLSCGGFNSQPSKLVGSRGSINRYFDFDNWQRVTAIVTTNLNKIIDVIPSKLQRTLICIAGSLGLVSKADTFILLGMTFYSPEVNYLDATGTLQPDMWGVTPSNQWDWVALRAMIEKNEDCVEIKQRTLVDMAADRGCYIDQSQSLNIHMDQPNFGKLTSMHFYAWSEFISLHISDLICLCVLIDYLTYTDTQGLKTGMYYLDHDLFEIPAPAWMNVSLRMKHVPENDNNLINKKALALQVELCYEKNGGVATFLFFSLTMFLKVWYD